MRFSWTSLLLAPLLVPVIVSTALAILVGENWLQAFLTMLAVGCVASYGAMIFLFLPCLFLLSVTVRMTALKACLLGLVLGEVMFLSFALFAWGSRGPDSDLPSRMFFAFFLGLVTDPVTAVVPLVGLTTAGLYWWLAGRTTSAPV